MLDIAFVRAQFPAFSEPSLAGTAFFENAGGSYPCRFVIDRLTRFYRERKVQPFGPYLASRLAGEEMDEARDRMAALLNVAPDELLFGPSTSQNVYVLARAFAGILKAGDAIVVTDQDHEANSGAWRRLADQGIEVREWRVDPDTGHLDPAALARLLDGRVRLVAFPHCSNIVAEINPVAEICALVHQAGAVACVDGVSYAPPRLSGHRRAGGRHLSLLGLQDLWPPSGADGGAKAAARGVAQSGPFLQRRRSRQAADPGGSGPCPDRRLRRDGRLCRRAA
ncbi:MAG: hypothetical protein KatS3mg118_0694 [Paracoccaceae bacterium]|nr:MAG: hypothetical protein KatS3mg118_0694 [Paracoccaceae bacterium]